METQKNNEQLIKALEDQVQTLKAILESQLKIIGIKDIQIYQFREKINDLEYQYQEKTDDLEYQVKNLYWGFPRSN